MDDRLISKLDAADMLGVSVSTVERLIADGDLPMYKIRGQCRLMTSDSRSSVSRSTYVPILRPSSLSCGLCARTRMPSAAAILPVA